MAEVHYRQATRVYPGNDEPAVDTFDLDIADGEFMVLVGPSGSGKTTALRMLAGLEEVDAGAIYIGERDVTDVPPKDRDVAMVFQNYALYPYLTVEANIAFPLKIARMKKAERAERVREVAELLELTPYLQRKPGQLSGGQRQRVAMGRAIVRQPSVFLMDEPLSNLDAKLRVQMRADIAALQSRLGVTTVYVTHDQAEAMTLGHRVAVMRDGRLQQCDVPRELYERPANTFVAGFIGSPVDEPARDSDERTGLLVLRCRCAAAGRPAGVERQGRDRSPAGVARSRAGRDRRAGRGRRGGRRRRVRLLRRRVRRRDGQAGRAQRLEARTGARGEGLALPAGRRGARVRRGDGRPGSREPSTSRRLPRSSTSTGWRRTSRAGRPTATSMGSRTGRTSRRTSASRSHGGRSSSGRAA